ncbi:MAG: flagellar hook-length control protein FliK [Parashewanella sp.]
MPQLNDVLLNELPTSQSSTKFENAIADSDVENTLSKKVDFATLLQGEQVIRADEAEADLSLIERKPLVSEDEDSETEVETEIETKTVDSEPSEEKTPNNILEQIESAKVISATLTKQVVENGKELPSEVAEPNSPTNDLSEEESLDSELTKNSKLNQLRTDEINLSSQLNKLSRNGQSNPELTSGSKSVFLSNLMQGEKVSKLDPIADVNNVLSKSLDEQVTDDTFKSNVEVIVNKHGAKKYDQPIEVPVNLTNKIKVQSEKLDAEIDLDNIDVTAEDGLTNTGITAEKSLSVGQTLFSSGALSPLTKVDASPLPQFQVSLKQGGEQQVPMQDMIERFSPVMKQQVMAMVSKGIGHAEIRLDPPELGHMLVKIQVQQDQTQVQFHVSQPQARDLLEQAAPRLRELLAEQGLDLADSQISYQNGKDNNQQGQNDQQAEHGHTLGSDQKDVLNDEQIMLDISTSPVSGIDYYA